MPKKKSLPPATDRIEKARADLEAARLALVAAEAGIDLPPRAGVPFPDYISNVKHDLVERMQAMNAAIMLLDEMAADQGVSQPVVSTARSHSVAVTRSNGQVEG